MDSLTQIVLGSTVAALATPPRHRRAAIIAGAALGTLPDLDVVGLKLLLNGSDPITEVTWHRGPSHSLFLLPVVGWLIWLLARRFSPMVREAPRAWLWAIWLALITHPILDAFTVYGTQLWWPLPTPPAMWASVFVIDPLYTLPLLLGVVAAWILSPGNRVRNSGQMARDVPREPTIGKETHDGLKASKREQRSDAHAHVTPSRGKSTPGHQPVQAPRSSGRHNLTASGAWLMMGMMLSCGYLAWSMAAKTWVDRTADQALARLGLQEARRFSVPMPFNTLLWRVVAMAPDGYWIGDRSLLVDQGPMNFRFYPSDTGALQQVASDAQVQRLLWFTHGFVGMQSAIDEAGKARLILTDLRMGLEPDYFFRYDIAGQDADGHWVADPQVKRLDTLMTSQGATLSWIWRRIFDSDAAMGGEAGR
ncbi:MAG: metal-dependent hydrolase [Lautropia sp.]|nr:metal-dependent hydrolase [Lautropia sp.]